METKILKIVGEPEDFKMVNLRFQGPFSGTFKVKEIKDHLTEAYLNHALKDTLEEKDKENAIFQEYLTDISNLLKKELDITLPDPLSGVIRAIARVKVKDKEIDALRGALREMIMIYDNGEVGVLNLVNQHRELLLSGGEG
jgi:hypothetical protein